MLTGTAQVGIVPQDSRVVVIQTQAEHRGTTAKPKLKAPFVPPPKAHHRPAARAVSFAVSDVSSAHDDTFDDEERSLGGWSNFQAELANPQAELLHPQQTSQPSSHHSIVPMMGNWLHQHWSLQSPEQPLPSPGQAELPPSGPRFSFSGSFQRKSSFLSPAPSGLSQHSMLAFGDEPLQSASGSATEELSCALDNGDSFEGGDTLKAFSTISQVCLMLCVLCWYMTACALHGLLQHIQICPHP